MASTFQYPTLVSRTLDPQGKSLRTIVALHDHEITDADINLIQDSQDSKRAAVINDMVASGGLTYAPATFNTNNPNTFVVPGFDVMFNGQVVRITGNLSADITQNRVNLPLPAFWGTSTPDEDARIYVVFLELWYQSLNPITGQGYYQDPNTKLFYYYPYGGVNPGPIERNDLARRFHRSISRVVHHGACADSVALQRSAHRSQLRLHAV